MKDRVKRWLRSHYIIFVIAAMLVVIFIILHIADPVSIISKLGERNALIALGIFAVLGGVSSFTSAAFYVAIGTFSAGGVDPLTLILVSGVGLTLGDTLFYLMWLRVRHSFTGKLDKRSENLAKWFKKRAWWSVSLATYGYTGFAPFPGDILMLALAIGKYPWRKFIIPILLGNITLMVILTFFGGSLVAKIAG